MKRLEKVGMWPALIAILPFTKISLNIQKFQYDIEEIIIKE